MAKKAQSSNSAKAAPAPSNPEVVEQNAVVENVVAETNNTTLVNTENDAAPVIETENADNIDAHTSEQAPEVVEQNAVVENAPMQPILTDQMVAPELNTSNTILNKMGVRVKVSDTAAKILAGMDNQIKFVK